MRRVIKAAGFPVALIGGSLCLADFVGVFGPGPSWVGLLGVACIILGSMLAGPIERGFDPDLRVLWKTASEGAGAATACIYAELSEADNRRLQDYQDLALDELGRAVELWNGEKATLNEQELIEGESAFRQPLRDRPEFQRLLRPLKSE
jgi:hypothetical protein